VKFLLVWISKDSHETSLGMPLLHRRPLGTDALSITNRSVHQELAQPCMNQHGIDCKAVIVPVKEKLGVRHVGAVIGAHEMDRLMTGKMLMANTQPPQ
jgi:hypothetical protein